MTNMKIRLLNCPQGIACLTFEKLTTGMVCNGEYQICLAHLAHEY